VFRTKPRYPKEFTMKKVISGVALSLLLAAGMTPASAANPTLAITNLTAGQGLNNAAFTVRGTAKGGAGVTNVFYSLNAAGWSNAASANGWTNWSADLMLTPGTNSFAAYAQDHNGKHSTTNKVNFAYVVLTPLTVRTNGTGSISPNYDGVPLQIGAAYSMTATSPIAGFGLQTWTDASNNIITNSATLKFIMASNLTYVANLGDVTKPLISVTSVVTNAGGVPTALALSGTASDRIAVTNVQYSLNNAPWSNAITGDGWSHWSAQVTVVPGTNIIYLQSVDSSGNRSLTNTVKSFFTAFATLTVRTNGPGKITPLLDGATLVIGTSHSLKATGTKTGYGLVTWTDGNSNYLGNTATLNFVMKSNLTLIANIGDVTLPTIIIKGAYTNSDGIGNDYVIWGTAADNLAVSNVFYSLNNGAWTNAATTNNWKKWTANVSLMPGANTFSAYALDGTSNKSATATMAIDYNNSAPSSLAGLACYGFYYGINPPQPLSLAFGKSTFSQFALDTNAVTGVGSSLYFASGASATLRLTYTGPPSVASHAGQNFSLLFYNPKLAYFTNNATKQTGFFQFVTTPKLALTNVSGQLIWTVNSEGSGYGMNFNKGKFVSQALATGDTNGGSYTYGTYSRNTALLKLTRTNGTAYLLTGYAGTNYGSYLEEDYDSTGHTNGTDEGTFLVNVQQPGGNAPHSVTNSFFEINAVDGTFNEYLGTDTYSQDTLSTNYDNDVGGFTYTRATTNVGQLNLTVTEPPNLAGSDSLARLIYVSPNTGLFTNGDGTTSTFLMGIATNLTYASISNAVITLNYNGGGGANYFYFDALGTFYVYNIFFGYQPYGTYTYQVYSPGGAMIHLNYGYNDWLQINFKSTNSGYFYGNSFDSSTNNDVPYSGNFHIQ